MKVRLSELGLGLQNDWIASDNPIFRPSSWPPKPDWPVSIDRNGEVLSRYGEPVWDLTPMAGTIFKLNFGDGKKCQTARLDSKNANILRQIIAWRIWGPRPVRAAGTLQSTFTVLRAVVSLCSANGILATSLMRFPKVLEQLPTVIAPSRYERTITELHRIYDSREELGFTLLDQEGIQRLAGARPNHETVQTPYIPPRIWNYQTNRLRECIDDFLDNLTNIESCFQFCLEAYTVNYGTLKEALKKDKNGNKAPFTSNSLDYPHCIYRGKFSSTAELYRITPLIAKWLGHGDNFISISSFSAYFTLVTAASLAYIATFTLQRKEEVGSLRASCLLWENDEKIGRVPIICGETTKTDPDSDARWVASPSVEFAVKALTAIANMRMICDSVNPNFSVSAADVKDPYLFTNPSEPWGGGKPTDYEVRREIDSLGELVAYYSHLFDSASLTITHEDLKIAKQLTPNLPTEKFEVGKVWPLAWHQYRRTTAVNMFASGLISDSSMQHQMKHSSRLMPLYYGRGFTRLHLNENVSSIVVTAMYESMASQLRNAMSERFVSPYSEEHKKTICINIISTSDSKKLVTWAKQGKVSYREHRLGGCMKAGVCDYGGVESVAKCAGSNDENPCSDALFDKTKEPQVRVDLSKLKAQMVGISKISPRYQALLREQQAMENYLNAVQ